MLSSETMFKRMFRVFAFIYVHHFTRVQEMESEAHLNAVFKHFLFFTQVLPHSHSRHLLPDIFFAVLPSSPPDLSQEFNLIPGAEMAPLADLVEKFTGKRPS